MPGTIALNLLILPQSLNQEDDLRYITCGLNYNCGDLIVPYPFWGGNKPRYCGREGFEVKCLPAETISIRIASQTFTISDFVPDLEIVKMVRTDIPSYDNCSFYFTTTSLDSALFTIYPNVMNMTLFYDCVPAFSISQNNFTGRDDIQKKGFFVNETQLGQFTEHFKHCRVQIQVPVTRDVTVDPFGGIKSLKNALDKGFDVQYEADRIYCAECMKSGGICGSFDGDGTLFDCHCRNGSYPFVCPVLASTASDSFLSIRPHEVDN